MSVFITADDGTQVHSLVELYGAIDDTDSIDDAHHRIFLKCRWNQRAQQTDGSHHRCDDNQIDGLACKAEIITPRNQNQTDYDLYNRYTQGTIASPSSPRK